MLRLSDSCSSIGLCLLQDHIRLVVHALLTIVLRPSRTVVRLAGLGVDGRCYRSRLGIALCSLLRLLVLWGLLRLLLRSLLRLLLLLLLGILAIVAILCVVLRVVSCPGSCVGILGLFVYTWVGVSRLLLILVAISIPALWRSVLLWRLTGLTVLGKLVEASWPLWTGALWTRALWTGTSWPGTHWTAGRTTWGTLHASLLTDQLDGVLNLTGCASDVEQLLSHVGWRVSVQLYMGTRLTIYVTDCLATFANNKTTLVSRD